MHGMRQTVTKIIDYVFSIGSPWSYIGLEPFLDLVEKTGAEIRPYLTTVVEENGGYLLAQPARGPSPILAAGSQALGRLSSKKLLLENRPPLADPAPAACLWSSPPISTASRGST